MEVNKQYYKYWKDLWSMQTEEVLDATALVRVMECTNGCVQHAFRDGDERALPVEQKILNEREKHIGRTGASPSHFGGVTP